MRSNSVCPKCRAAIPLEDVNVSTDLALCRKCGQTWSYADLVDATEVAHFDPVNPPRGAWYREELPDGFLVGASTRSWAALFLVPFMCVWSGFSLGGIYGTQIVKGQFSLGQSLFGIPFVLGTLLFGSLAAMTVCGKVVVRVNGDEGSVFTGVGPIGWRRRFSWRGVTGVRRTERVGRKGGVTRQITLDGEKNINIGGGNPGDKRAEFMYAVLLRKFQERSR